MAMKYYIVCVPQKWSNVNERQVAVPYSIQAEGPLSAARLVFAAHPNLSKDANGEILVVEAKAGRLDNWHNYYELAQVIKSEKLLA